MARVREVKMDGMVLKISPFTYDETEAYLKSAQEMHKRDPKPNADEWAERTLETVCVALNKAMQADRAQGFAATNGDKPWDSKRLKSELDMVYIFEIHTQFLLMSGLEAQKPGEARATSTSL